MLHIPIEQRYRRENRVFHSSGFAIAAGVVAVGAAAGSAAVNMSAADRAAKAQSAASSKYNKQLKKATDELVNNQNALKQRIEEIDPNLKIPKYNLQNATLEGIQAANRVTANTLQQLEKVAPGSTQARQQVGGIISSYLRGEIPQDVREQTMRNIAEVGGAGFNIATAGRGAGIQAPQANLARNLGLTSLNLQQTGINAAQSWQQMAGQFIQSPTQLMQLGLQGRGQDITVSQANIENQFRQIGAVGDINTQIYNARTGQAQQGYNTAQQNIGANLAAQQSIAQGIQSIGSATSGALMGVSGAYGQLATAQGASTVPTSAGFYQGQVGAANAYNVAPSQLSYQKGGGYYYTPSGVYGR